jgi:hypothetical protein
MAAMVSEKSAAWDAMMGDPMCPPWCQYGVASFVSLSLTDFAPECNFPVEGLEEYTAPVRAEVGNLYEISKRGTGGFDDFKGILVVNGILVLC